MKTMSQKFKNFLKRYRVIEISEHVVANEATNVQDLPDDKDDLSNILVMVNYKKIHSEPNNAEVLYDVIDEETKVIYPRLTYNQLESVVDEVGDKIKAGDDND